MQKQPGHKLSNLKLYTQVSATDGGPRRSLNSRDDCFYDSICLIYGRYRLLVGFWKSFMAYLNTKICSDGRHHVFFFLSREL